jgi:hypothetical protein
MIFYVKIIFKMKINLEKSDWKDISEIIDDALDEVKDYEFDLTKFLQSHII